MSKSPDNLFAGLPRDHSCELFTTLLSGTNVRIERIVSRGHSSPPGFWYDQPQAEWVLVIRGAAILKIDGQSEPIRMGVGDSVNLPAHQRHRVEWTMPDTETVWLAVHYDPLPQDQATH